MSISHRQSNRKKKLQKASIKINRKLEKKFKISKNRENKNLYKRKRKVFKTTEERRNCKIQRKLNKEKQEIQSLSRGISAWLSAEQIKSVAIATGYLKKINPKIPPLAFIITLAYGLHGNGASTLIELAASMSSWFNINITAQALSGRTSKKETVNFLKCLLLRAMAQQIQNGFDNAYAVLFSKFKAVMIEDSTQFVLHEKVAKEFKGSGGSASKSAMKLNTVYNITNHTISDIEIVPGATSDQTLSKNVRKQIKKGVLWIRDLGYFNILDMCWIIKIGGYFLSRLKKGVNVFLKENDQTPIQIETWLENNTKDGSSFDREVYIGEGSSRVKVRIVGEKVPEEVRQKRIAGYKKNKIKRDKKKKMGGDYIIWFGYSIFITNAPKELLSSATIIMSVYKIRWQIELFFKRIKSILEIHILKGKSGNRVHCLIYAKLISLMMSQTIMSYAVSISDDDEELSEHKLISWLKNNNRLVNAVMGILSFEALLIGMIKSYYLLCKNKRNNSKSTLRYIQEAFSVNKTIDRDFIEVACNYGF